MHNLTTREVEKAAGLVAMKIKANAHKAVVSGARTQEDADREQGTWLTALDKAETSIKRSCIDSSNITVWWPLEDRHHFGFESAKRTTPYTTSVDTCECEAFKHGTPCWHRAGVAVLHCCDTQRHEAGERPAWGIRRHISPAEFAAAAEEMFGPAV